VPHLSKNRHKLHGISTSGGVRSRILNSIMRGAFVVQLKSADQSLAGHLEGSVEEVDTGKQAHFRSVDELLRFLRERFAESCHNLEQKGPKSSDYGL
jgi:hypothetical protein